MSEKKIPQRMCIVCREMHDKKDLIRLTETSEGQIIVDAKGKCPGRGAYVCKDSRCVDKMKAQKVLSRTFHREVTPRQYEEISEGINAICFGQN